MNKRTIQQLLLPAILLLAVALRVWWFDLMEFKGDEVGALLLARYWLSRGIPQFGLISGVGVRNPPGFMFFLWPQVAAAWSPLSIGLTIVAFNVAAVWLLRRAGVMLGSAAAGTCAAALAAAHPWLILYSRKIWAQSLLPFLVTAFLLAIFRCALRRRSRAVFWTAPLVCMIWQVHYSGYCVVFFLFIWLTVQAFRRKVNWPWAAGGAALAAVTLIPYVVYLAGAGGADLGKMLSTGGEHTSGIANAVLLVRGFAQTAYAGDFGYPFAFSPVPLTHVLPGAGPIAAQAAAVIATSVLLILALCGGFAGRRVVSPAMAGGIPWLGLFVLMPPVVYALKGIPAQPHYFILGLPALLLLAGIGAQALPACIAEQKRETARLAAAAVVPTALAVMCGASVWLFAISAIHREDGTAGDYGRSYRVQAAAAHMLAEEGVTADRLDARRTRDASIGVRFLLQDGVPSGAARSAELIDTSLYPGAQCAPGSESRRIGPLLICLSPEGSLSVER